MDELINDIEDHTGIADDKTKVGTVMFQEIEPQEDVEDEEDDFIEEVTENLDTAEENTKVYDWSYKLNKNEDVDYDLKEFDSHLYKFKRIFDPSNKITPYYTIHCNIDGKKNKDGELEWHTKNANLSKKYVAASLDKLSKYIKENMNVTNEYVNTKTPFIISWNCDTVEEIKPFNREIDQVLFESITGIDMNVYKNASSKVRLNVLNSYDGRTSMFATYLNNMVFENKDGNKKNFIDYFTMNSMSKSVPHMGTMDIIKTGLENVSEKVKEDVEKLKKYKPENLTEIMKECSKKLRGDVKKSFNSTWDSVPSKNKNMFYALLMLSSALNKAYNSKTHLSYVYTLNPIISKMDKWIKDNEESV